MTRPLRFLPSLSGAAPRRRRIDFSLAILSGLLTLLTLAWARADEVKVAQSGPGVTGTLAPIDGDSPVALESEFVQIALYDRHAAVTGEYFLTNAGPQPVHVRAGFPTLALGDSAMGLTDLEITVDGVAAAVHTATRTLEDVSRFRPHIPLLQMFSLSGQWRWVDVAVPGGGRVKVVGRYQAPYLFKQEELAGRDEESARLFQYLRADAARWSGVPAQATISVRAAVTQVNRLSLTPPVAPQAEGQHVYNFANLRPSGGSTITALYDPIRLHVTEFGFPDGVPPVPLETDEALHGYENLFDGDPRTAWCEGEHGDGAGRGFEIEWGKVREVRSLEIFPGYGEPGAFQTRNRIKTARLYPAKPGWRGRPFTAHFADRAEPQTVPYASRESASLVVFEIVETYPGTERNETCVAEVGVRFEGE